MTTLLLPPPISRFEDNNGNPASGFRVFAYAAGTTTKQNTFTDSTGGVAYANPVILNSRGEANIWLTTGTAYKSVLAPSTDTDPPTNSVWTVDNVVGVGSNTTTAFSATLLAPTTAPGWRTVLGSTTVGDALFVAADAPTTQATLNMERCFIQTQTVT